MKRVRSDRTVGAVRGFGKGLSILLGFFWVAAVPTARAATVEDVVAVVEKIAGESGLRTALVGFCLVPLDGNPEDAAGYRIDSGLVPASTMKVFTTATANEVLGPDFRFVTELQTTGSLDEEGVLEGNLVIRGGGDPTLAATSISGTFAKWKEAVSAAGIKKIEGAVVGDASLFGTALVPDTWQWNDIGNYYGAGACGLTVLQNLYYCSFRTASAGAKAAFTGTNPKLPGIEFFNEMRVGPSGSGDQGYIYGDPYGKVFYFRGTVPAGSGSFTIKGALPDPAFFCARTFSEHLVRSGVPVSGEPTTDRLLAIAGKEIGARKTIHQQSSEPLASLLVVTNHRSDNLRAECLHRMVGVEVRKKGTTGEASSAVRAHWAAKGIDMTGFYMGDGCGLSRANTVTPRQMALTLYHASQGEHFETFYASLPTAGRSGTLSGIGKGSAAEGRVRAKSGTLDRIRNYSGYVNTRSGKRYAFALFVNNYTGDLSAVRSKIVRVWSAMVAL